MSDNFTKVEDQNVSQAKMQWGKMGTDLEKSMGERDLSDKALIDFKDVLTKYRERTEFSLPYTMQ